jgi:CRISPR/Cas system CMR subunit Cmr6 (Cas7 group RAMP superfamily)
MESKDFEREVLERLAKIETKIDDYKDTRKQAEEAYNKSVNNEKEICDIQEKLKWISRTIIGTIITAVVGAIITFLKIR